MTLTKKNADSRLITPNQASKELRRVDPIRPLTLNHEISDLDLHGKYDAGRRALTGFRNIFGAIRPGGDAGHLPDRDAAAISTCCACG